jgi:GTP-binding protein YchF
LKLETISGTSNINGDIKNFKKPIEDEVMPLKCGIIGLPNVGKSTIFNLLTSAGASVSNYPFTTIEPNIGVVPVEDEILDALSSVLHSSEKKPSTVQFVDIAGLVKGASKGEGLGNRFLSHIRDVHAVAHIVRCFLKEDVTHVEGKPDPIRDIEIVNTELALADLETVERKIEKLRRAAGAGVKEAKEELEILINLKEKLQKGEEIPKQMIENETIKSINLLTIKPSFIVANYSQGGEKLVEMVKEYGKKRGIEVVEIDAKMEEEILELKENERKEFYREIGGSALTKLVKTAYRILNLITFYTGFEGEELRAWSIKKGSKVIEAAGMIHSDMEKGFIKAEIIGAEELIKCGSEEEARAKGLFRTEGRDYVLKDKELIRIKFKKG